MEVKENNNISENLHCSQRMVDYGFDDITFNLIVWKSGYRNFHLESLRWNVTVRRVPVAWCTGAPGGQSTTCTM